MRKLLKASFFIFIIGIFFPLTQAQSADIQIFSRVFKDSGLKIDAITYEEFQEDSDFKKKSHNALIDTFSLPNSVFSNSLKDLNYKILFFVCNSNYEEKDIFTCSTDEVANLSKDSKTYEVITLKDTKNNEEIIIHFFNTPYTNIFVLNASLFENTDKLNMLSTYLGSINRSSRVSVDNPNISDKNFNQNLQDYLKSTTFEIFVYAIITFILVLLSSKIIVYLHKNYKNLNFKILINLIDDLFFGTFAKNKNIKLFLIVSILFYIVLFLQLVIGSSGSKTMFIKNLFLNFFDFNFFNKLSLNKLPEIIFYSYSYFLIFLFIVSKLDYVIQLILNLFNKVRYSETNSKNIKNLFLFLYIISIVLLVNFFNNFSFELLIFFTIFNILVFTLMARKSVDFYIYFSNKQKITITTIVLLLVGISIYFQNSSKAPSFKYENLIGISDKVVLLPYKKQTSEDVLFNSFKDTNLNYPLFVDEFLVFHPEYSKYLNKNISKFEEKDENFILVAKSSDRLLRGILSNPKILTNLDSSNNSRHILVNQSIPNSDIYINLNVNCTYKDENNFRIKSYFTDRNSFKSSELNLGNLVGCNSDNKTYTFKLPNQILISENFIVQFINKDLRFINSFFFENSSKDTNLVYKEFEVKNNFYFYIESFKNSNGQISNYFVTDKTEISFGNTDFIENINILKKDKFIGNTFNIWSLDPYRIIINNLD